MDLECAHQEQQTQTKTSPASVVLTAKGESIAHATGATPNCERGSLPLNSKQTSTGPSTTLKTNATENVVMSTPPTLMDLSHDAIVVQANTDVIETHACNETVSKKSVNDTFAPATPVTRSRSHRSVVSMQQAVAVKQPIHCRLRISPPRIQPRTQSENTCNLDTIASVACQIAQAETAETEVLRPGIQPTVSFVVPATVLGKRVAEPLCDNVVSKVQKTIDHAGRAHSDAPTALAAKSLHKIAKPIAADDAEMTPVGGRTDGQSDTGHRIRTANRVTTTASKIVLSAENHAGLARDKATEQITLIKDRLIMQGSKGGLSTDDKVSLVLRNSTCRSAMQDVMQQFEAFKEQIVTELCYLRHELAETRTKLLTFQEQNCRLSQSVSNCECHAPKQIVDGLQPQSNAHATGTKAYDHPTMQVAKTRGSVLYNEDRGDKGSSPGLSTTGGSQSSGSQLTGPEGSGVLVVRAGSESETTPCETGSRRKSSRKGRGGPSKRRRDNWTAAENSSFLALVRQNEGMEEMDLRRMLAKHFAPRRTHEQCANHLRILRAQKKVPPAIGEAVPYRQKGAPGSASVKETEANGL